MRQFKLMIAVLALLPVLCASVRAEDVQEKVDLKKKQLIEFKNGVLWGIDIYGFKAIEGTGVPRLDMSVRQEKIMANSQDCGKLGARRVIIYSANDRIEMNASEFDEFVAAKDYFKTYEDVWDTMDKDKKKFLIYDFAPTNTTKKDNEPSYTGRLRINGDRENLRFDIISLARSTDTPIFSTADIKIINQFNGLVNDVQKFLKTHRFEECL